ncbi:CRP-like cAMP-binding protein [Rhodobium orientis]|uniref:Crp/Fnr family transcriptional regulator n=1 Tax=Rhodobium orientis TaxID=34017 RepID=A0A327JPU2_9HYPH|nr:cyclic nucleotide-binding domain-containing protein [Rhodobium orientis]MBB4304888.1 CRP-like cAMP-binding protein [Rhodobium orientis]MBK5949217.1 Crp/Fnr family transcriptional regulator [Rhodobium orientis]RAI27384.1 Crp/Fnr family transcriptional regulator [Rhodobium orientis]
MVDQRDMASIIGEVDFFDGLPADTLELLAGCAKNVRFNAGDYIYREGQAADTFYIIRHGSVAVQLHVPGRRPLVIESLTTNEVLGWSWIVAPYRWSFDAQCVTLVRALAFDATCLRGKMETDCAVGYEMLRRFVTVMSQRLRGTRIRLADMYAPTVNAAD